MGDWEFLYEMSERGYSGEDIVDAACSGAAPWEWDYIEEQERKAEWEAEWEKLKSLQNTGTISRKEFMEYLEYVNTEEDFAVLFVKKYLVEAKGHWVDIIDCSQYDITDCSQYDITDCSQYEMSSDDLHFRFVIGGLYKLRIQPIYPSKSAFTINGKFDKHQHDLTRRVITWKTAHKDIELQKSEKVEPRKFKITGVCYDKNRNNKNFFRADAPPEIKALANNLRDRTNPLWGKALQYAIEPEFIYEIKKICIN
ncbi:conserved hypothetical protein [Beggiatoa sp. PS]|nr:conserved hypothetical protein [Beggiatoa sp. PS]